MDRSGRSWVIGAIAAVVLVAALVVIGRWWTHPTLFEDHGDGFRASPQALDESAMHVGLLFPPAHEDDDQAVVTIRQAEAHFAQNTAEATVAFAVCHYEGDPLGYVGGPLGRWCTEVTPISGETTFRYEHGSNEMVVMTIAPTRRGTARVDSVTLDYSLGSSDLWRRGTQSIALDATVVAK